MMARAPLRMRGSKVVLVYTFCARTPTATSADCPLSYAPQMERNDILALCEDALLDGAHLRSHFAHTGAASIAEAVELIVASFKAGGKLLLFGNGGSAADAQHIAAELVGRYTVDRAPIAAIALTVDTSALTAIGNDFGYDHVFSRQLQALGKEGDVVIAISTSGRSPSIKLAVAAAKEMGVKTIALTGASGTAFAAECDAAIIVPTKETARIQELHITVGHILCAAIERAICDVKATHLPRKLAGKTLTLAEAREARAHYRAQGRTVVWTNGCFDLVHAGHITSLRAAKKLGDILIVGVNSDASVKRLKGESRPYMNAEARAELLSALGFVDHVVIFEEDTPEAALKALEPDVHCKGSDYAPPNGKPIPEAKIVEGYGGTIAFLPMIEGISTTDLVSRIRGPKA